jgi:hypothetical protein
MEIPAQSEHFTPMQLDLLRMFATNVPEEQLKDIKRLIAKYFLEKMRDELDEHIKSQGKTVKQWVEEVKDEHFRTPYNNTNRSTFKT